MRLFGDLVKTHLQFMQLRIPHSRSCQSKKAGTTEMTNLPVHR
jgi:hypothetical protein